MRAVEPAPHDDDLRVARRFVRLFDDRFLDPLIGLVFPGAGDFVSAALGLYLVRIAFLRRLPPAVIARMLMNLGVDALSGSVPVIGDLFDFAWKANKRNLALLEARDAAKGARASDWLLVAFAGLFCAAALVVPVALVGYAVWRLVQS